MTARCAPLGHAVKVVWPYPADRERLAATFDEAAALYQRVRPEYPPALYEGLLDVTGLAPAPGLLEVGCATGKGTLPLARLGFHVTAWNPAPPSPPPPA